MSVLLPNATATVTRRVEGEENAHGERTAGGFAPPEKDPLPALIEQRSDGGWAIALDDALWPVREGDVIIDGAERMFVVQTASHLANPVDSTVDYIACEALRLTENGTEPSDPWFVGREG